MCGLEMYSVGPFSSLLTKKRSPHHSSTVPSVRIIFGTYVPTVGRVCVYVVWVFTALCLHTVFVICVCD